MLHLLQIIVCTKYIVLVLQPPLKVIIKSQQNSITWKRMVVHSSKCTGSNIWLGMKWKANKCLYFLLLNVKAQYCWMLNFKKLQQKIMYPATYSFINIRQVPPSILPTPQVHTFTIIVIGRWTGQGHSPTRQHRQRVYRLVICFDHLMDGQDTHTPLQNMKLSSLRISVAFIYSASSFPPPKAHGTVVGTHHQLKGCLCCWLANNAAVVPDLCVILFSHNPYTPRDWRHSGGREGGARVVGPAEWC